MFTAAFARMMRAALPERISDRNMPTITEWIKATGAKLSERRRGSLALRYEVVLKLVSAQFVPAGV